MIVSKKIRQTFDYLLIDLFWLLYQKFYNIDYWSIFCKRISNNK